MEKENNEAVEKSEIEKANEAAARLEQANKTLEENIKKLEKLKVEKIFSGNSETGYPVKTKDEEEEDAAFNLLKGTGLEYQAFPHRKR